ncbi:MAG: hypothetical protein ACR2OC_07880 [Solirubrobacterales bacterium]
MLLFLPAPGSAATAPRENGRLSLHVAESPADAASIALHLKSAWSGKVRIEQSLGGRWTGLAKVVARRRRAVIVSVEPLTSDDEVLLRAHLQMRNKMRNIVSASVSVPDRSADEPVPTGGG